MLQDTTAVAVFSNTVSPITAILIGAAASAVTGITKAGADAVGRTLSGVDQKVTKGLGPVWPILTMGFAAALPLLSNATGITDLPSAAVIGAAPVSAFAGIVIREAVKKVVGWIK